MVAKTPLNVFGRLPLDTITCTKSETLYNFGIGLPCRSEYEKCTGDQQRYSCTQCGRDGVCGLACVCLRVCVCACACAYAECLIGRTIIACIVVILVFCDFVNPPTLICLT